MKANVIEKLHSEEDVQYEIYNLKKLGYKRIENCVWVEYWEKENWIVKLVRDF